MKRHDGELMLLTGHLLRLASNRAQTAFGIRFNDLDISALQFSVLTIVAREPGISHRELSDSVAASRTVMTTLLKPMLVSGTLTRKGSAKDPKQIGYYLTGRGEEKFEACKNRIGEAEGALLENLDDAETEELNRLLAKLIDEGPS